MSPDLKLALSDAMISAYCDCALWSSTDDDGDPLDGSYGIDDISPETLRQMIEDCKAFSADAGDMSPMATGSQAGHDFWLTRNGHGAGFWDRGNFYGDDGEGQKLTDMSKVYGSFDLYIGDDGLIYGN